jgi:YD repeat-containing protein
VNAPSGTSYSDIGLTASTSYTYRARASDAAGNLSSYSTTASNTTISGANAYSYDANGRLSTITTSTGTAHYYYDVAGNVTSIVWTIP